MTPVARWAAGTAVIAKALFFAHIAEQAAGGGAAKHAHCHPHHGNAGQVLRRAAGKQHTQLGLGQAGDFLVKVAGFVMGMATAWQRAGARAVPSSFCSSISSTRAGSAPCTITSMDAGGEDAVILGFEVCGVTLGKVTGVAAQLDARGGVAVEFAAGLAHAVEALSVELGIKATGQGSVSMRTASGSNAPSTGTGQRSCRTRCRRRRGQVLPRQRKASLMPQMSTVSTRSVPALPGPRRGPHRTAAPSGGKARSYRGRPRSRVPAQAASTAASVADSRFAGKRRCSVMRQRLNLEASSVVMQTPGASCLRSKSLFLSNINRY